MQKILSKIQQLRHFLSKELIKTFTEELLHIHTNAEMKLRIPTNTHACM